MVLDAEDVEEVIAQIEALDETSGSPSASMSPAVRTIDGHRDLVVAELVLSRQPFNSYLHILRNFGSLTVTRIANSAINAYHWISPPRNDQRNPDAP